MPVLGSATAWAAPNRPRETGNWVTGYLYVNGNTSGTNTVVGFARYADGTLSPLAGSPFATAGT